MDIPSPTLIIETWDGCTREQAEELVEKGQFLHEGQGTDGYWGYWAFGGNMVRVRMNAPTLDPSDAAPESPAP